MLDSKIKFGLILHTFKGRNHGGKAENKATEEHELALGCVHTAGEMKDGTGSRLRGKLRGISMPDPKTVLHSVNCQEDPHPISAA